MKNYCLITMFNKYRLEILFFLIFFVLIPSLLIWTFSFPVNIKNSFKANLSDFNPITFYTTIFIHDAFEHLLYNILGYYFYTLILYLLSIYSRNTCWLMKSYLFVFAIFPVVDYPLLIIVNKFCLGNILSFSFGFSGIVSALIGLTPISLLIFIRVKITPINKEKFSFNILSVSGLIILYVIKNLCLFIILAVLLILSVWFSKKDILSIFNFLRKRSLRLSLLYILTLVAVLTSYIFGILLIFPSTIVMDGGVIVNILAHYFGLVFGFSIAFLLYRDDVY